MTARERAGRFGLDDLRGMLELPDGRSLTNCRKETGRALVQKCERRPPHPAVPARHAEPEGGVDWRGRDTSGAADPVIHDEKLALEAAKLALDLGADVNAANDAGDTTLHGAAAKGYEDVVRLLVSKGALPEAKNKRGGTPLAVAKKNTADVLRQLGAKE